MEAVLTVEQSQPDPDENMLVVETSAKSQDFFQDNKGIGKNILLHVLRQEIFYPT